MNQIIISDLPETIQTLLSQAQITGDSLTITKDGIPLAVIEFIKKKPFVNEDEDLLQVCERIGRNAQARGLTEEILEELLADES